MQPCKEQPCRALLRPRCRVSHPIATKLCYAIAGVVAIVGAISVYVKMNNEEQDVKKSIMMIIGACVFLIAAAQALPLFFGIEDGVITGF